jgi:hypothetical protein
VREAEKGVDLGVPYLWIEDCERVYITFLTASNRWLETSILVHQKMDPAAVTSSGSCFDQVRRTTQQLLELHGCVCSDASTCTNDQAVTLHLHKVDEEIKANAELYGRSQLPVDWAQDYHFADGTDLSAQYVLVLSAINSCFWPLEGYEYCDLAGGLKRALEKDPGAFEAEKLVELTPGTLQGWLEREVDKKEQNAMPMLHARTRLLNQVGRVLLEHFDGQCANMVRAAGKKASTLIALVSQHFPGFRDHAIDPHSGEQVFFYKRAQIFIGDIYGTYDGVGLGEFTDLEQMTCFPDYRIPQLLREVGIITYGSALAADIDAKVVINAGSIEEMLIRAATVQAVERMCSALTAQQGESSSNKAVSPFQLDWILWERGEAQLDSLRPHHRTRTIYY